MCKNGAVGDTENERDGDGFSLKWKEKKIDEKSSINKHDVWGCLQTKIFHMAHENPNQKSWWALDI